MCWSLLRRLSTAIIIIIKCYKVHFCCPVCLLQCVRGRPEDKTANDLYIAVRRYAAMQTQLFSLIFFFFPTVRLLQNVCSLFRHHCSQHQQKRSCNLLLNSEVKFLPTLSCPNTLFNEKKKKSQNHKRNMQTQSCFMWPFSKIYITPQYTQLRSDGSMFCMHYK